MVSVSGQGHSAATPRLFPRTSLQITNQTQPHEESALVQLPPLDNEKGQVEIEITGKSPFQVLSFLLNSNHVVQRAARPVQDSPVWLCAPKQGAEVTVEDWKFCPVSLSSEGEWRLLHRICHILGQCSSCGAGIWTWVMSFLRTHNEPYMACDLKREN